MEVLRWLLFFAIAMFLTRRGHLLRHGQGAAAPEVLGGHHRSGFVLIRNPMTPITAAIP